MSELVFKIKMFSKTFAYEMLPMHLAALTCSLCDGYTAAFNRFAVVFGNPAASLLALISDGALLTWLSIAVYIIYHDDLPAVALYELVGYLILPMIGRAMTVATKYALYSDLLLSGDLAQSLKNKEYHQSGQQGKNQLTSYIADLDKKQKENLIRFLYSSCLYADTDLSSAALRWQVEGLERHTDEQPPAAASESYDDEHRSKSASRPHRIPSRAVRVASRVARVGDFSRQKQAIASVWAELASSLRKQAGAADTFAGNGGNQSVRPVPLVAPIEQSCAPSSSGQQGATSDLMFDPERREGAVGHGIDGEEGASTGGRPSRSGGADTREGDDDSGIKHPLVDCAAGLLTALLREDEAVIQQRLAGGELPCAVVALHIVFQSSSSDNSSFGSAARSNGGLQIFLFVIAMRFVIASVPVVVRSVDGDASTAPFGSHFAEHLFYALQILPNSLWAFTLMWYACSPCSWYYRQIVMAQKLLDLISPPRGIGVAWTRSRVETSEDEGEEASGVGGSGAAEASPPARAHLPRLDLTKPQNVEGWAMLRRVVYGRNFAPAVELKFQVYGTITFMVFIASSATNSLAHYYSSSSSSLPSSGDFDFIFTSIFRLVVLSIPLIAQVVLASRVNEFSKLFNRALTTHAFACCSEAAALSLHSAGEDLTQKIEELNQASALLAATKDEVDTEMDASPMRVLFATATPAVASLIVSAIFGVLALQVNGVQLMV